MHTPLLRGVTFLAAVVAALGASSSASAQPVTCGQVVTQDVTLDGDLVCDGAPALIVGADRATIDLAGHSIMVLSSGLDEHAVDNTGGFDRVTIRDGAVSNVVGNGIVLEGASRNRLVNLSVGSDIGTPILVEGGERNTIADGDAGARGTAIVLTQTSGNRLLDLTVLSGIEVLGGERNAIESSDIAGRFGDALVVVGSDRMRIVDNTAEGFANFAMDLATSSSVIARNDTSEAAALGAVRIRGSGNRILQNDVGVGEFWGLGIVSGSGNVVAHNNASGILGLAQDGIFVAAQTADTNLRQNVTNDNADDGIDVESAATRLIGNTANDNGDLGIEAVPGVTGRGNTASGNGNPLQCLNVVCR
jgi:parallel beta-helix repeat protein